MPRIRSTPPPLHLEGLLLLLTAFGTGCCGDAQDGTVPSLEALREQSSESIRSPDGELLAFVRRTPEHLVEPAADPEGPDPFLEEATEIWTASADGRDLTFHVRGEHRFSEFRELQFSPDGRRLYFLASRWVTSHAVHYLDLVTGEVVFVLGGNSLEVVPSGPNAGCLLTTQHRYFIGGGSYDFLWLCTPDGRSISPVAVGEDGSLDPGTRDLILRNRYWDGS